MNLYVTMKRVTLAGKCILVGLVLFLGAVYIGFKSLKSNPDGDLLKTITTGRHIKAITYKHKQNYDSFVDFELKFYRLSGRACFNVQ